MSKVTLIVKTEAKTKLAMMKQNNTALNSGRLVVKPQYHSLVGLGAFQTFLSKALIKGPHL